MVRLDNESRLIMEEKAFSEIAVRLRGKAVGTALACGLDAMQADEIGRAHV